MLTDAAMFSIIHHGNQRRDTPIRRRGKKQDEVLRIIALCELGK
jgi:hypothetical protein